MRSGRGSLVWGVRRCDHAVPRYGNQPTESHRARPIKWAQRAVEERARVQWLQASPLVARGLSKVTFSGRCRALAAVSCRAGTLARSAVQRYRRTMATPKGTYEPSPAQWVRDQVETYERSGGA